MQLQSVNLQPQFNFSYITISLPMPFHILLKLLTSTYEYEIIIEVLHKMHVLLKDYNGTKQKEIGLWNFC